MRHADRIATGVVLALLALNAFVMLVIPSFPTLDGWAHLHTSRMLMDGSTGDIFCANPGAVPNRSGHILLGLLQVVLPAMVAERVLLALILWLIGWGTWRLARAFGSPNLLVLLVLPFTWNFTLLLGFHNFLLGVGLALVTGAWWVSTDRITLARLALLVGWTLLLYTTHSTALLFFLAIAGAHEVAVRLSLFQRDDLSIGGRTIPGVITFGLAILPATVLLAAFHQGQGIDWSAMEPRQALSDLKELRVLLLYHGWDEGKFGYAMKLVLVAAAVTLALSRANRTRRPWITHRDALLGLALVLIVISLVLPDSTGLAGFITVRLQLMIFLLLVVWMGAQPVPPTAALAPVIILLMLHQARLRYIAEFNAPMAEPRDKVLDAAMHLPEGSIVLPINFDHRWELGHMGSLLGVERKLLVLDNYECSNDYFPLKWCPGLPDPLLRHLGGQDQCLDWLEDHVSRREWPVIEHIVLMADASDSTRCELVALDKVLGIHYTPAFDNGYVRTYALRKP